MIHKEIHALDATLRAMLQLSLTGKRWNLRRPEAGGIPNDIVSILAAERGIDLMDGVAKQTLSDPSLFPEMEKAVARIERAMSNGEKIAIFGDYDADGITGSAQLVRFFRRHGTEHLVHLPDRLKEGYGMKEKSVAALLDQGVTLIITVDTGITAHKEIAYAASRGADVIVTDHHRPQGGRPPASAVIHPQVPSDFPNQHLSGSGVAFMLVRALEHGNIWEGAAEDCVLAAIGTIGDVVPLTGENRLLVTRALGLIDKLPPSPLKNLIDDVRTSGKLTSGDIAFRVVPRINAAGRLKHPMIALSALLDGGDALAQLHALNGERQMLVADLMDEAMASVDKKSLFIAISSEKFTPGIVGLIAGRLTETFGKPSIVGAVIGDECVCSLRSVAAVDVVSCLEDEAVRSHLLHFGGHAQAAGCSVQRDVFPVLAQALQDALVRKGVTQDMLVPSLDIDATIPLELATIALARRLGALEPFGCLNAEPTFVLRAQRISEVRTVGSDQQHLQCKIGAAKAIGFGLGSLASSVGASPVDIVCRVGINAWNGREEVNLFIQDIALSKAL